MKSRIVVSALLRNRDYTGFRVRWRRHARKHGGARRLAPSNDSVDVYAYPTFAYECSYNQGLISNYSVQGITQAH